MWLSGPPTPQHTDKIMINLAWDNTRVWWISQQMRGMISRNQRTATCWCMLKTTFGWAPEGGGGGRGAMYFSKLHFWSNGSNKVDQNSSHGIHLRKWTCLPTAPCYHVANNDERMLGNVKSTKYSLVVQQILVARIHILSFAHSEGEKFTWLKKCINIRPTIFLRFQSHSNYGSTFRRLANLREVVKSHLAI